MQHDYQIELEASHSFAALSGDFNVQHLDPVSARRLIFGTTVVHGVHLVMLALDRLLGEMGQRGQLAKIRVVFSAPVPAGATFSVSCADPQQESPTILIMFNGQAAVTIDLGWVENASPSTDVAIGDDPFTPTSAIQQSIDDVASLTDCLPLRANRQILRNLFPNLEGHLTLVQAAVLLTTTRIVGMHCPGANSVFVGFDLNFVSPLERPCLAFFVSKVRPALGFCSIGIEGPHVDGQINALFRPPPASQRSMTDIKAMVTRDEFARQNAVIIGGSRGLGELAAKIIAAGGGRVAISYCQGKEDAERVAAEISACDASASTFHFDVTDETEQGAVQIPREVTHLYYFATPRIAPEHNAQFDMRKFELYCGYYVRGLERLLSRLLRQRPQPLALFNPSTGFLDHPNPNFAEYIAAKGASEALCLSYRAKFGARLQVRVPRLPRLHTDQTTRFHGEAPPDGVEALLSALPR